VNGGYPNCMGISYVHPRVSIGYINFFSDVCILGMHFMKGILVGRYALSIPNGYING
jgi:hypothetical protein